MRGNVVNQSMQLTVAYPLFHVFFLLSFSRFLSVSLSLSYFGLSISCVQIEWPAPQDKKKECASKGKNNQVATARGEIPSAIFSVLSLRICVLIPLPLSLSIPLLPYL